MTSLLKRKAATIISIILFILCIVGSVRTLIKTKNNRQYVLYRDKLNIYSTTLDVEIDLSKVFMVKAKRNILDILFKNGAHTIYIYAKGSTRDFYILPFIGEDADLLVDEILKLAIQARENKKSLVLKVAQSKEQIVSCKENLISKKSKNLQEDTQK